MMIRRVDLDAVKLVEAFERRAVPVSVARRVDGVDNIRRQQAHQLQEGLAHERVAHKGDGAAGEGVRKRGNPRGVERLAGAHG